MCTSFGPSCGVLAFTAQVGPTVARDGGRHICRREVPVQNSLYVCKVVVRVSHTRHTRPMPKEGPPWSGDTVVAKECTTRLKNFTRAAHKWTGVRKQLLCVEFSCQSILCVQRNEVTQALVWKTLNRSAASAGTSPRAGGLGRCPFGLLCAGLIGGRSCRGRAAARGDGVDDALDLLHQLARDVGQHILVLVKWRLGDPPLPPRSPEAREPRQHWHPRPVCTQHEPDWA